MKAKNLVVAFSFALGVLLTPPVFADGIVVGTVEYIRVHDGELFPGWGSPSFWFSLVGVSNLGSCPGWVGGKTLFVGRSKEALALVLSSQLAGRQIAVSYSDQPSSIGGYGDCRAAYVTVGNPTPHF